MEEQLEKYLTEFVELLKEGGQFALDQLPGFIHEYLTYYAWYHGFWATLSLTVIIAVIIGYIKVNKHFSYDDGTWDGDWMFFLGIISFLIALPATVSFFINLFNFLKVIIAPRLYLIENLMELV